MAGRKGAYARLTLKRDVFKGRRGLERRGSIDDLLILLFTNGKEHIRPEDRAVIRAAKRLLYVARDGPAFPVPDWDGPGLPSWAWLEFVIYELLADEEPDAAQVLGDYLKELRARDLAAVTVRRKVEKKAEELGVLKRLRGLTKAYIKARRYLLDAGLIEKRNDVYRFAPGGFISFLNRLVEIVTDFQAGGG